MIKHRGRFILGGVLAGWLVDLLFWKASLGLSLPLWVGAALVIGFALLYSEGLRPSRLSWVLAGFALLFSVISIAREEPFTSAISLLMTAFLLALLVATLRNGNWLYYRMMDAFLALLRVGGMAMGGLWVLLSDKRPEGENAPRASAWRQKIKPAAPLLRGLLLALPVLLVLGGLLASADPVFNDQVSHLFDWLKFDNLEEFLIRAFYVVCVAYIMIGLYIHAVAHDDPRPDAAKQSFPPFLGFIESCVVLVLVDLMFLLFVGIQFIYLFGGQTNITAAGYTYADYARRGFFELVSVAVLSLMLYLTLGYITRRETERQKRSFTILVVVEILLVMMMLVSAFQRMALYQAAYGFSELRVQVNVLMVWLGLLLIATLVLEILRRSQHFGLAALTFCVGFVLTMGAFNMDAFIVEQNVARARQGAELDGYYLRQLSDDATPAIYAEYTTDNLPAEIKDTLGRELACRTTRTFGSRNLSWLEYRFNKETARGLLLEHSSEWRQYSCEYYSD